MSIEPLPKNTSEEVRFQLTEFNGHELFDIRIYVNDSYADEGWKPTRKGIALQRSELPSFLNKVKQLVEKSEE